MKEGDLRVFLDGLIRYFAQTTDSSVEVGAPYLLSEVSPLLSDYSGRIKISGDYNGDVLFTAPHRMLIALLARYGHRKTDKSYLLDLVGEIANTIAGNAREHFGSRFDLSTPDVTRGGVLNLSEIVGLKSYCFPLVWEKQNAKLIISVMAKNKSTLL